jgi:hypothetical protein
MRRDDPPQTCPSASHSFKFFWELLSSPLSCRVSLHRTLQGRCSSALRYIYLINSPTLSLLESGRYGALHACNRFLVDLRRVLGNQKACRFRARARWCTVELLRALRICPHWCRDGREGASRLV